MDPHNQNIAHYNKLYKNIVICFVHFEKLSCFVWAIIGFLLGLCICKINYADKMVQPSFSKFLHYPIYYRLNYAMDSIGQEILMVKESLTHFNKHVSCLNTTWENQIIPHVHNLVSGKQNKISYTKISFIVDHVSNVCI